MWARVSRYQGVSPERMEATTKDVRNVVLPACREIEGFAGLITFADNATGEAMSITFWESEGALRASEQAADEIRSSAAERHEEQIVDVRRFEVPVSTFIPAAIS